MKHHMYLTTKELLEAFGKGPKGKRVVSSDMVRWLLSEPPRHLVDVARIVKEPVTLGTPVSGADKHGSPTPVTAEGFHLSLQPPSTFKFEL